MVVAVVEGGVGGSGRERERECSFFGLGARRFLRSGLVPVFKTRNADKPIKLGLTPPKLSGR